MSQYGWIHYYQPKPILYTDFLGFSLISRIHPGHHIWRSCLLGLLLAVSSSDLFFPGPFWGVLVRYLIASPSNGGFLVVRWGFWVWGAGPQVEVPFLSHPVKGAILLTWLLMLTLTLRTCLPVRLLTPLSTVLFESHSAQFTLKGLGVMFPLLPLEGGVLTLLIWNSSLKEICLFCPTHSFTRSCILFISEWTPRHWEVISRKRQEAILLLLVHVQREGGLRPLMWTQEGR